MPLDSLRSEWYLRAFRGGCDYGGSGQVLRAALWYHSVRLRCHHALVARRLLRLQFCVWVSAAVTRPGISVPGLSVCALPSSFHPSPTPPRPPFRGSGRGGVGAVEIWMCPDARSEIRLEVVDDVLWLQFGLATSPGCNWISTAHPARPRRGMRAGGQSLIGHQQLTPELSETAMVSAESPVGTPWVSVCLSAPGRPAQRERSSPGQCRRLRCEP